MCVWRWNGVLLFHTGHHESRGAPSTVAVSSADNERLLVSVPSADPLEHDIPVPEGITPALYQVPSSGLTRDQHDRAMEETLEVVKKSSSLLCGFMAHQGLELASSFQCPFVE